MFLVFATLCQFIVTTDAFYVIKKLQFNIQMRLGRFKNMHIRVSNCLTNHLCFIHTPTILRGVRSIIILAYFVSCVYSKIKKVKVKNCFNEPHVHADTHWPWFGNATFQFLKVNKTVYERKFWKICGLNNSKCHATSKYWKNFNQDQSYLSVNIEKSRRIVESRCQVLLALKQVNFLNANCNFI